MRSWWDAGELFRIWEILGSCLGSETSKLYSTPVNRDSIAVKALTATFVSPSSSYCALYVCSRAADCTAELPHTQQHTFYNIQTTHPHLASKLRMSGGMSPLPSPLKYLYGMHEDNFTFACFIQ